MINIQRFKKEISFLSIYLSRGDSTNNDKFQRKLKKIIIIVSLVCTLIYGVDYMPSERFIQQTELNIINGILCS